MNTTYFKAIRPDGTDFHSGVVRWAPRSGPAVPGSVVRHPWALAVGYWADSYLSASTVATDCTGMWWLCRLLEVEPVDAHGQVIEPVTPERHDLPNKRAAVRWRIVRELDPMLTLGPQAEQIAALVERASRLTQDEAGRMDWQFAPHDDSWRAAGEAARVNHRAAVWNAVYDAALGGFGPAAVAARMATTETAQALLVRDLIGQNGFTQEHYDRLTGRWRRAVGPIHPDDEPLDTAIPT